MFLRLARVLGPISGALFAAYLFVVRPWYRRWGVVPLEGERVLAGDDVLPGATTADTRGITIEAPPSAVWPWLLQMGFGRAGWYSYDRLDNNMASSHEIRPEWQQLAEGEIIPTHPEGGFRIERLEPDRALVLYLDDELVRQQAERARAARAEQASGAEIGARVPEAPVPLRIGGGAMGAAMHEFKVSWAFVLEPLEGGRTRLIERFRVMPGAVPPFVAPFIGFGVFVMMRKQMIGIRDRVEASRRAEELGPTGAESLAAMPA